MSNDVSQSPIILDTPSTTAVVVQQLLHVIKVVWQSGASGVAGDQLLLKDKAGKTKLDLSLNVAKGTESQTWPVEYPLVLEGLIFHTCSHGTVYLYCKQPAPVV